MGRRRWAVDVSKGYRLLKAITHVFSRQVRLVKVPSVGNVSAVNGCKEVSYAETCLPYTLTLNDQRSIWTDQHGASTHTTDGSSGTLFVNGNVTAHDDGVSSIPTLALDPVDTVEQRSGGTVTGVLVVDTLNVVVARGGEEVHEQGLCGFRLVDQGLGTDV